MSALDITASITDSEAMPKVRLLSEQVRDAVERSELSRYAICKAIGLDQSAMSRFMSGERGLSLEVLDRLGVLLGLSIRTQTKKRTKNSK
jgi:transcriptional regulator with XRE-family HTH domain